MAIENWSTTAASNALVDGINWQEGQAPSTVNNSAREMMAQIKTWYDDVQPILTATTVTVGSSGTFATLKAALDWALTIRVLYPGSLKISLLAGDHDLEGPYEFAHPDAQNITIEGQTLTGAFPVIGDFSGTKATDKAMIEGKFPSRIVIDCPGSAKNGLTIPNALRLKNVAVFSNDNVRYSVTVGAFSASWQTARGTGVLGLDQVFFFGGVWSIIATNAYVLNASKIGFAWHVTDGGTPAGGPMLLRGARLQSDTNVVNKVVIYSPDAIYGFDMDDGASVRVDNALTCHGPNQAIFARGGNTYLSAAGCTFSGGEIVATIERGAGCNFYNSTISSMDAMASDAPQEEWQGNSGPGRSLFWLGHGAQANIDHCTFDGCEAYRLAYVGRQASLVGLSVAVDDCKWSGVGTAGVIYNTGGNVQVSVAVTNPRAGSSDQVVSVAGGYSKMTGSSGVTYSPSANTESTNGSWTVV